MPDTTTESVWNTIEVELLPCPFCGGAAETDYYKAEGNNPDDGDVFYIRCEENYCVDMNEATPEWVCDTWNRRDGKLLVEQAPEVVRKIRLAYHSTYFAVEMLREISELANWMVEVVQPESDGDYQTHSCPATDLKSQSHELLMMGWVRKDEGYELWPKGKWTKKGENEQQKQG